MSSQTWLYSFVVYFILVSTFIGMLSQAGMFEDSDITTTLNEDMHSFETTGANINTTIPESTSVWDVADILKDIFGFFVFGLDLGIGAWEWVIRLIFVYIPVLFFGLGIYFAVRSGS